MNKTLKNHTIIITGATRGIGRSIALRCARDGANIVIIGKTDTPHPTLAGTIHTVAEEVKKAGGQSLAIACDVRDDESMKKAIEETVARFGGIDALVNNAGAIQLSGIRETPLKKYDLMMSINSRAVFAWSQACLPYLEKSANAHILSLSPPIDFAEHWLKNHGAYTLSKYGMTMHTMSMAAELREVKVAVNSLWPRTTIATAAINMLMGDEGMEHSRTPEIMADAAYAILNTRDCQWSGEVLIDEEVLRRQGVTDFSSYAVTPGAELFPDLFMPPL